MMLKPAFEMKDSGIEWVGKVPAEWNIVPLYSALNEINHKNSPISTTNILSLTNTEGVIPYSERGNQGNKAKESFEEYKVVYPNTIVANSMNILIGSVGLSNYEGCVSPVYYVYSAKPKHDIHYLNYLFQVELFQKRLRQFANGIMEIRLRVSSHDILHQKVMMPSYREQQAIAEYLDDRCNKIDAIIAEATASIEEYKELKQAVISEAVTKGLYNNPTIYSGDPNIGDVSEGWNVCKTLYGLAMPITDGPHTTPELYDDGVPFISAEAVSCGQGSIDFDHMRGYISEEFYQECCKKYIPAIDDIYMIKSGATTGRVSMVDTDRKFTIWSPLAVFRVNKDRLIPRYLFYFLQSKPYQQQVQLGWTFGTQQNIGMRTLEKLKICLPPLDEQSQIVEYLDTRVGDMNNLISEKQDLIDDLQAYKKSLIYEVVTGKRRVV